MEPAAQQTPMDADQQLTLTYTFDTSNSGRGKPPSTDALSRLSINYSGLGGGSSAAYAWSFFRQHTHSLLRSFLLQVGQKRGRSLTRRVSRKFAFIQSLAFEPTRNATAVLAATFFQACNVARSRSNHVEKMSELASSNDRAAEDRPNLPT